MRSRVTPGVSSTIARRRPVIRLKRVDLPTLGRPTMATVGGAASLIAELPQAARVAGPVALHPDEELEEDPAAEEALEAGPRGRADRLDALTRLPDDDPLLRLPLDVHGGRDPDEAFLRRLGLVVLPRVDHDGRGVG